MSMKTKEMKKKKKRVYRSIRGERERERDGHKVDTQFV